MVITAAHITPLVALICRYSHPADAAAAQLHRRDLSHHRRIDGAQCHPSFHPMNLRRNGMICDLKALRISLNLLRLLNPHEPIRSNAKPPRKPVKKARAASARKPAQAGKAAPKSAAQASGKGKWVYAFGGGKAAGRASMRNLLGGKGAGLAEMAHLGLPVPPGFTITTEVCTYFYAHGKTYPKDLKAQVEAALAAVGRITGKTFGDKKNPLLVSVRSGARASMPGMMDTVLNLGLNDTTVAALAEKSGDRRFALDSYRRFITMYSDVVLGIEHQNFEEILDEHKERNGYTLDTDLNADDLQALVEHYKKRVERGIGQAVPAGCARAIVGRHRRRIQLVDESARHHLPSPARYSGELGHRGQCAGHGVRQYGRYVGHRRSVHAQSVDRREKALRRVPDQRPGRGRRRRHPHAAGNHRGRAQGVRFRQAVARSGAAQGIHRAQAHPRRARAALSRHAGSRIHHRAGQALDAADAQRQAHGAGGAAHRGRTRAGKADHQGRSGGADRSRARSTSCCIRPSIPMPSARSSPPACRPRPARRPAKSCSRPRKRSC